MSALAGTLRDRVAVQVRDDARDDLGGASGAWGDGALLWAAVRPDGAGMTDDGRVRLRWAVTVRSEVAVPERLRWLTLTLAVRYAVRDPANPDRIVLHTEEVR